MIEIAGVSKTFPDGTMALESVSLTIAAGELVGLMGSSGAGKTTLLRLINGALRPDTGKIRVMDQPVPQLRPAALRALRRQIGLIYQHHGLVPALSVLHNVLLGGVGTMALGRALLRLAYVPAVEVQSVAAVLAELGLQVPLGRAAAALSGGQQQRVAVARSLWQRPRLLLADEPVASVDTETAEAIMAALVRRTEGDGLTTLVSLHQRAIAQQYCRRVIMLERGRVIYDGAPAAVFRDGPVTAGEQTGQ